MLLRASERARKTIRSNICLNTRVIRTGAFNNQYGFENLPVVGSGVLEVDCLEDLLVEKNLSADA